MGPARSLELELELELAPLVAWASERVRECARVCVCGVCVWGGGDAAERIEER